MDFEQLKRGWQQQSAPQVTISAEAKGSLMEQIAKVRKAYVRQNIAVTLMLVPVIPVTAYIWYLYQADFGWRFDVSILLLNILMAVTLAIHWYKTTAWHRYNFTESTVEFLQHLVKRLRFIKWLSYTGSLIYVVLIWLIFVLYIWEVGQGMEPIYRYLILAATTAWTIGSYFWGVWRQRKKDAQNTDPLLAELEALLQKLRQ